MRYIVLFFAVLFSLRFLFSQDAVLSQYNSFPLYTNMAMAGSKGCSRVVMGTRLQWLNVDGGYKTYYFSYDQYSMHLNSGLGFEYYRNDEADRLMISDVLHLSLSPHFPVGRKTDSLGKLVIKPAINFGYLQNIRDTNVVYGDVIDPVYGFIFNTQDVAGISKIQSTDFGAGAMLYGQSFYAGIYFHHLTSASIGLGYDVLPIYTRMTIQSGYVLRDSAIIGKFSIMPSFIYERQGGSDRLDLTLYARYRKFSLGTSLRLNRTMVLLMGFSHKIIKLGYSYEVNRLSTRKFFGTTHEINMSVNVAYRKERKKIRTLDFINE
ncbi:MAG: type IX secretion system membrane protein PorP/SprF [Bacteroidetes bacterium]|nr:MAG: type IX secretion system membrane protein PorP/SprF [Bacteroidota bacterium]